MCTALAISFTADNAMTVKASVETTSQKIKDAEQLKKTTEEMKEATEQKKEGLMDQKQELESYLTELNDNLTHITENIGQIEGQIADKQEEIAVAQAEVDAALAEEQEQYDLMKKRIKFMYERGERSLVMTFFSSRSYADFLNKAEYTTRVEDYDRKMYDNLIQIRSDIESKEEKLRNEEEQLQSLKKQAERKGGRL